MHSTVENISRIADALLNFVDVATDAINEETERMDETGKHDPVFTRIVSEMALFFPAINSFIKTLRQSQESAKS